MKKTISDTDISCTLCKQYAACGVPGNVRHDWDEASIVSSSLSPETGLIRKHFFMELDFQFQARACRGFDKI